MAFGSRGGREDDIATLVAKKQYAKAIEIIREQLKAKGADSRMRLQLADVLVLAGRVQEVVAVLLPLADEYARDGFAAKAISVLKRIQKIDPSRRDIESRLAGLIEEKQRLATVTLPPPPRLPEIGIEEIGDEPGFGIGEADQGEGLEIGIGTLGGEAIETPTPNVPPEAIPEIGLSLAAEEEPPEIALAPVEAAVLRPTPTPAPVVDRDLVTDEGEALVLEADVLEALPIEEEEPLPADPMTDDLFAQELLSALEEAIPSPSSQPSQSPAQGAPGAPGGTQIVVSPLFKDFSVDELVMVIQGLRLLIHEPGDVILNEGEAGNSLYMLTSGKVKAFRRSATGRSVLVGELTEGGFFGEGSILTGKPRNATVVAASRCELLELDRPTLESIAAAHPHVWDVLREFAERRMKGA